MYVLRSASYQALGALTLLGAALWSGYAIMADAPIVDESPHLAAGVSYVALQDYRLNPEHPPLTKVAAGAVACIADPRLPIHEPWWKDGINEQWRAGGALLWSGHNDPAAVVGLGRLGVTLLNFALLIIGWRVVARYWDEKWALAFLVLTAASPFFLGHGHLVTTDITAAGIAALACAALAAFLKRMTWQTGLVAAIALGVAQLAKFSLVLLIPAFLLVALVMAYQAHGWKIKKLAQRLVLPLAVIAAAFALVVFPTYAVLTANGSPDRAKRDAAFLLSSFAGGPDQGLIRSPLRYVADATIFASGHKLTQPLGTYGLGVLMVMQRSAGGNTAYFNNEVGSSGSKLYFPLVYATKETLAALLVAGLGLAFFLRAHGAAWRKFGREASPELVLAVFAVLYLASTFTSSLNIGIRHLFPVLPALYLIALAGWRTVTKKSRWYGAALAVLIAGHAATAISSLPYPLSYYNPLGGGTAYGYEIAADSNYDWGQDALRLRQWIDAHPEAGKVAVDIFGASNEEGLLGDRAISWWSARGNPQAYGINWIAISSSYLLTATAPLVPGEPRLSIDEYRWLQALRGVPYGTVPPPDERAGTSIFIYRLD